MSADLWSWQGGWDQPGLAQFLDQNWPAPGSDVPPDASAPAPTPPTAPPEPPAPPAPAAAPTTGTSPPTGVTSEQRDAKAIIDDLLGQYGLQTLSDWAWGLITQGASTSQITVQLRDQPAFQQRFPAIADRQKAGLPPISPAEYLANERQYAQIMRAAGLPEGFYDQPEDFHSLIAKDVSPSEIQARVNNGFDQVNNAPDSVKQAFFDYYGTQGSGALASLFLDDTKAAPVLERMAQAAVLGGTASTYGLPIDQATAEKLSGLGISEFRLRSGLDQAGQLRPLYDETVSEHSDITGQQGLEAALGTSPDAQAAVQRRLQERQAAFAGGGGSVLNRQGLAGLGGAITND